MSSRRVNPVPSTNISSGGGIENIAATTRDRNFYIGKFFGVFGDWSVSESVEEEVFKNNNYTLSGKYKNKNLELWKNLCDNKPLVDKILNNDITAGELVTLSPQEMANEKLKQTRKTLKKENVVRSGDDKYYFNDMLKDAKDGDYNDRMGKTGGSVIDINEMNTRMIQNDRERISTRHTTDIYKDRNENKEDDYTSDLESRGKSPPPPPVLPTTENDINLIQHYDSNHNHANHSKSCKKGRKQKNKRNVKLKKRKPNVLKLKCNFPYLKIPVQSVSNKKEQEKQKEERVKYYNINNNNNNNNTNNNINIKNIKSKSSKDNKNNNNIYNVKELRQIEIEKRSDDIGIGTRYVGNATKERPHSNDRREKEREKEREKNDEIDKIGDWNENGYKRDRDREKKEGGLRESVRNKDKKDRKGARNDLRGSGSGSKRDSACSTGAENRRDGVSNYIDELHDGHRLNIDCRRRYQRGNVQGGMGNYRNSRSYGYRGMSFSI